MYKNIGRKIKGFSIVFAWTVIALSCFYASYRLFSSEMNTENIIISVAIIIGGVLLGLIISWFLYAYGAIAENTEKQNENIETLILAVDDLSNKIKNLELNRKGDTKSVNKDIPLNDFKLPESREEVFQSQLRKLKKDYEMSRITYDEYEDQKLLLEEKYR